MARPDEQEVAARRRRRIGAAIATPGAITMIVCLFLPQTRDCHGHASTPLDNGSAPWLVIVAAIGLLPLAFRWRPVRRYAPPITMILAGFVFFPLALVLMVRFAKARRIEHEVLAAASAIACLVIFLLVFPLSALLCHEWLIGAHIAWAAATVEMIGLIAWWLWEDTWLLNHYRALPVARVVSPAVRAQR